MRTLYSNSSSSVNASKPVQSAELDLGRNLCSRPLKISINKKRVRLN